MVKRYMWSFAEKFGQGLFVSDNGDYVKYEDYAALQQKLDAMAAENAAHKTFINQSCYSYDGDGSDVSDSYVPASQSPFFPKNPATDAYLNSVRADGVAMFAEELGSPYGDYDNRDYETGFNRAIEVSKNKAIKFANQLRSGTHDTADKAG